MNIGFLMCVVLVIPFLMIGFLFAIFKEKAAKFVSGFNLLLSYFVTSYMAIPAYIVWGILFFKEVHSDTHKAFEKYLLK